MLSLRHGWVRPPRPTHVHVPITQVLFLRLYVVHAPNYVNGSGIYQVFRRILTVIPSRQSFFRTYTRFRARSQSSKNTRKSRNIPQKYQNHLQTNTEIIVLTVQEIWSHILASIVYIMKTITTKCSHAVLPRTQYNIFYIWLKAFCAQAR